MKNQKTKTPTRKRNQQSENVKQTLSDHLAELRRRLLWIAVFFIAISSLLYPFYQTILHWLLVPIGTQQLYYNTPAGGISFILKVCMYAGFIAMLPVAVYHLYKFVSPVIARHRARSILLYTTSSFLLALAGVSFAYFLSLPAALHFLTHIELTDVSAMITVDAYLSFVMAYLTAGALLFQLPLIMLIINSVTPLPPRKLMSYQRYNIVASFVIAALITPTPDIFNQLMIALPMIFMYQLGVIIIWLKQRRTNRRITPALLPKPVLMSHATPAANPQPAPRRRPVLVDSMIVSHRPSHHTPIVTSPTAPAPAQQKKSRSIDGFFAPPVGAS